MRLAASGFPRAVTAISSVFGHQHRLRRSRSTCFASLFFPAGTSKLLVLLFGSHAVLPISFRGRQVVRTNIRFTDRTTTAWLACYSLWPPCADFRADWLGQNVGGVSSFSRCMV